MWYEPAISFVCWCRFWPPNHPNTFKKRFLIKFKKNTLSTVYFQKNGEKSIRTDAPIRVFHAASDFQAQVAPKIDPGAAFLCVISHRRQLVFTLIGTASLFNLDRRVIFELTLFVTHIAFVFLTASARLRCLWGPGRGPAPRNAPSSTHHEFWDTSSV